MPNPLFSAVQQLFSARQARRLWARVRQEAVGLAQDYWKDGHWEKKDAAADGHREGKPQHEKSGPSVAVSAHDKEKKENLWHALPGEISEKMWGAGYVTPCDKYVTDLLVRPLGITKDMSLLDLSAGLGGRMRRTTDEYKVYINGREPDPEIAARGMAISVAAGRAKHAAITVYDPANFVEPRSYDCILGRETIYRVADKEKFIRAIVACCKPKAQVSFTDYIVNPEARDQPAIVAWRAFETGAAPSSLVEMAEMWAKAGIGIRIHDDQTDYYKKEVKAGLVKFAQFMASGVKPDAETKKAIEKRIMTWAHRMAAIEQGMKFYRFYGVR